MPGDVQACLRLKGLPVETSIGKNRWNNRRVGIANAGVSENDF
jgi:hypothetical protein